MVGYAMLWHGYGYGVSQERTHALLLGSRNSKGTALSHGEEQE